MPSADRVTTTKVVVATTVALSFISFWRGAAIVLSDLASTMFYVGGISEQAIGKSAPWFVIAVMLFSFAVRPLGLETAGRSAAVASLAVDRTGFFAMAILYAIRRWRRVGHTPSFNWSLPWGIRRFSSSSASRTPVQRAPRMPTSGIPSQSGRLFNSYPSS